MVSETRESHLFCFGFGYVGLAVAHALAGKDFQVTGTCRSQEAVDDLADMGFEALVFDAPDALPERRFIPGAPNTIPEIEEHLEQATHILITIPPQKFFSDVVLSHFRQALISNVRLRWLGYLSTTGVYGDRGGDWVDETSALQPVFEHQRRRAQAEMQWINFWQQTRVPLHIFRLSGIYGPGRNPLIKAREGKAKCINQPGLVFGRTHRDDVVRALEASMNAPTPGEIFNVSDDEPASPAEVTEYACFLLGIDPPPVMTLEEAGLSEQGRSFYLTNKRVSNRKVRETLDIEWRYPTYREGLDALLTEMQ